MIKLFTKALLLLTCLFFSFCTKESPNSQATVELKYPSIEISQTIEGCKVENNSNYLKDLELTVTDSVFSIFKLSNQLQYFPIELFFSANVQKGIIQSVRWKVGSDPEERPSTNFRLNFETPVDISISAEITWIPNATASLRIDTIYKTLQILPQNLLIGSYSGISSNNPLDTFTVHIGEFESNIIGTQQVFFGVQNLFNNFPIAIPVNIYTSGFGICQAPFPYEERYIINGKFFSHPFGVAALNNSKDSIYINYSFVEYKDAVGFENMKTVQKLLSWIYSGCIECDGR